MGIHHFLLLMQWDHIIFYFITLKIYWPSLILAVAVERWKFLSKKVYIIIVAFITWCLCLHNKLLVVKSSCEPNNYVGNFTQRCSSFGMLRDSWPYIVWQIQKQLFVACFMKFDGLIYCKFVWFGLYPFSKLSKFKKNLIVQYTVFVRLYAIFTC